MKITKLIMTLLIISPVFAFGAVNEKAYSQMDKDGDGKVSHKEFVASRDRGFIRQDKNKDGFVDASEATNPNFIKYSDADKDGKVSREEAVANAFKVAQNFDKDGDGVLTIEELNPKKD
ncbi:MAG TPA: hypothetical protein VK995_02765 [Oceanipulchritudo sp.]|nr:hypothetical protein [Oceanipulchritudo sp.]